MFLNKFILMILLMLTMILAFSSSTWFAIWMSLEMNSMMIIPLMMLSYNQQFSESTIKYFLIQAISSMLFISMTMMFNIPIFMMLNFQNISLILLLTLMLKIGMFPFMFWYPEVLAKTSLLGMKLIMTMQKIIPIILISMLMNLMKNMFFLLMMVNALLGSILALNQTNMKKILAFSSISHMSWMVMSMILNFSIFSIFMIIYSTLLFSLISFMKNFNLKYLNQILLMNNMWFNLNLLSLAGMPPFSGFMMKWLILEMMMAKNMILMSVILIMASLISLYYYSRMMMTSMMLSSSKMKFINKTKKKNYKMNNFKTMLALMMTPFSLILMST